MVMWVLFGESLGLCSFLVCFKSSLCRRVGVRFCAFSAVRCLAIRTSFRDVATSVVTSFTVPSWAG